MTAARAAQGFLDGASQVSPKVLLIGAAVAWVGFAFVLLWALEVIR
jgi:hypothetical protein